MSTDSSRSAERFEAVDWDAVADETVDLDWDAVADETVDLDWNARAFATGLVAELVAFVAHHAGGWDVPVMANPKPMDWLLAVSLLALAAFVVEPRIRNWKMTLRYWSQFKHHRLGVAGLVYVCAFVAVGLFGPLFVGPPRVHVLTAFQPPVGVSIGTEFVPTCAGRVARGRCHGSWTYPLGTGLAGKDMIPLVVYGARTSLEVALVSATLLLPTGVAVGLVSASAGGSVDRVLMWAAEILQTIPAILIYFLLFWWTVEYRLLVMVAVFGLASWGSLARQVRNQLLTVREEQFVRAAEGIGAGRSEITRRHLLPNISSSVLSTVALQVPLLIMMEASVSFLQVPSAFGGGTLGDPSVISWGQIINNGIHAGPVDTWWIAGIPAALLVVTVVAFNVLGNALADALDPRGAH